MDPLRVSRVSRATDRRLTKHRGIERFHRTPQLAYSFRRRAGLTA
jgi:hypothetical protein